jgi:hypothetical protein
MKKQDPREKAAGLFKNDLDPEEEKEIIKALGEEGITPGEIESLRKISSDMENIFEGNPSDRMDQKFYSMIDKESTGQKDEKGTASRLRINRSWLLAAAGIALFILGWISASWFEGSSYSRDQLTGLSNEVKDLRETLVLTMLNQSSASERIRAVNMIKESDEPTSNMIQNLFRALNTDENDNVRLLALEALLKYTGSRDVREELVASISKQTSPMIQLRMAEIMTALNEKSAVPEFRRLLDDAGLNYSVRKNIQDAVGTLL